VLVVDPAVATPAIRVAADEDADEDVVERLRSWRRERSREDGVPPYVVLHDTTLRQLAATQPRSHDELSAVKGLGPVKVERYGEELLALLATA
jgi:ATP-dependent DNA helicase RecQ